MDRKQLGSLVIFGSMALVALMALVCRGFMDDQGPAVQLMLVTSALATVALLITSGSQGNTWIRIARCSFAALASLALLAWATGIAFALTLVLPIAFCMTAPKLFELAGWKLELSPLDSNPESATVEPVAEESPIVEQHVDESKDNALAETTFDPETKFNIDPSMHHELESEECDEDEHGYGNEEPAEDDPWSTVQHQFSVDSTLVQNVTQWQQPDGSRSIVANIRCHFSADKETCVVHLPFWPLLTGEPDVFCRVATGPAASIKTTNSHSYGLRLEIRLEQSPSAFPVEVIVEVVATCEANQAEQAA